MRILYDIIEDLKDGKKVDYEEARLAALVYSHLLFFAERDIEHMKSDNRLVRMMVEGEYKKRHHAALNKSPVEWLGSHHPDNPEEQRIRKISYAILDKVTKQAEEKGEDR